MVRFIRRYAVRRRVGGVRKGNGRATYRRAGYGRSYTGRPRTGSSNTGGSGWLSGKANFGSSVESNTVHTIMHSQGEVTSFNNDGSNLEFGSRYYSLSLTNPSYIQYLLIFEFYRINWVQVEFLPMANMYSGQSIEEEMGGSVQTQHDAGSLYAVFEPYNSLPPTTLDVIAQNPKCKTVYAGKRLTMKFVPRPVSALQADDGGLHPITTRRNPWIFTSSHGIPHLGLMWAVAAPELIAGNRVTTFPRWTIKTTYSISFTSLVPSHVPSAVASSVVDREFAAHAASCASELRASQVSTSEAIRMARDAPEARRLAIIAAAVRAAESKDGDSDAPYIEGPPSPKDSESSSVSSTLSLLSKVRVNEPSHSSRVLPYSRNLAVTPMIKK